MKYKLIKEYPGSPKLDTICKYDKNPWSDSNAFTNPVLNPKYYPEFWQEIVEKNYLITGYYQNLNNIHINITGNFSKSFETEYLIYQVKRLSDSEIFTIGDKCSPIGKYRDNIHSITKIWFCNPGYLRLSSNNYTLGIKDIQKVKIPLFTTEDGLDIFEGDNIYWVNINTFEKVNCNKYNDDLGEISIKSLLSKKYECKAVGFSTKEKAEEYILMNKPCLSLNDIFKDVEEMRKGLKTFENSQLAKRFKKLVKSKI